MTLSGNQEKNLKIEALHAEIHRLVTEVLESRSARAADALASLLREGGEEAQKCYTTYMEETHALRRAGLDASQLLPSTELTRDDAEQVTTRNRADSSNTRPLIAWLAVAASIAAVISLLSVTDQGDRVAQRVDLPAEGVVEDGSSATSTDVATLVRATRVEWYPGDAAMPELSRLAPGKRLRIESGQIELLFDSGVELVIAGRADLVIDSSMRVVSTLGKFSARVSERGRGFTIDTPATQVIDLGTEFGVEVAPSGSTKVAVFKGAVDLDHKGGNKPKDASGEKRPLERLDVGEAVLVDSKGHSSRVVAIGSEDFPKPGQEHPGQSRGTSLFSAVRDNIRSPDGKKFYRIVRSGLYDDVSAYVDRDHEWNGLDKRGLPKELQGADYIMPFNNDKFASSYELTLDLSAACTLYVIYDNNMPAPDWLLKGFKDTGVDIGLDQAPGRYSGKSSRATGGGMSIDDTFSVWARRVSKPDSLRLGGVIAPKDKEAGWNMYGIAATRMPTPPAGG